MILNENLLNENKKTITVPGMHGLLETPDQPIPYRLEGTLQTGLFYGYDVHLTRKGEIIPGDFIPE